MLPLSNNTISLIILFGSLGLGAFGSGVLALLADWQVYTVGQRAAVEPQTITLRDLIDNGPGANAHVRITKFAFGKGYVFEREKGRWTNVWIPVFPAPGPEDADADQIGTGPFRAVIVFRGPQSKEDVERYCTRTTVFEGLVTSEEGLNPWSSIGKKLLTMYPGTEMDRCLVIEEGLTVWSASSIKALFYIALGLLGVGGTFILIVVVLIIRDRMAAAAARARG